MSGFEQNDGLSLFAGFDSELFEIDPTEFPFRFLSDDEIPSEYALQLRRDFSWSLNPQWMRGNYVASEVSRQLRIETKGRKPFPDMQVIFRLPTEIVYEIFGHLHPIDLYSWVRTNESFREIFLSHGASSIWRNAFLNNPDTPSCPPQISLPRWTTLLFGPAICDECGYPDGTIDFAFNYRRCDICMGNQYWYQDSLEANETYLSGFPVERAHLWTLVPRSYKENGLSYPANYQHDHEPRYLKMDIDQMAGNVVQMLLDPNKSAENYEEFRSQTVESIEQRMAHAKICNLWAYDIYEALFNRHNDSNPEIVDKYLQKLRNVGYHPLDIEESTEAIRQILFDGRHSMLKFNRKVFREFFPRVSEELRDAKRRRLLAEAEARQRKRVDFVDQVYKTVKRGLDPLDWLSVPFFERVHQKEPMASFIKIDDESLTMPSEDSMLGPMAKFIVDWLEGGKLIFHTLFTESTIFNDMLQDKGSDQNDEIALAVFTCPNDGSVLFGWQDVAKHLNCFGTPSHGDSLDLKFSPSGAEIVSEMISGLSCPLETTSVSEMDSLNPRYICTACPQEGKRGSKGHSALTWKEMVSHILSNDEHPLSSFTLLAEDLRKSVLFHETMYPNPARRSWSCKLCGLFMDAPEKRAQVIDHIKNLHKVQSPKEGRDFFYYPITEQPKRQPYHLGLRPPALYCCAKCPPPTNQRLWRLEQLVAHLKNKHSVKAVREIVDYRKMTLEEPCAKE
ncbi:hypothetical protein CPB83DRAFT_842593 [Crepidotus variabilis]|uniref:F-box domain-containing protein n=1 Tax=Crepidotus variabilis TaxID=179855 RepID=A0A9P6JW21_9AGAR|nr:hypothetical protein CPB83DRAFT_842593 [Crepidotus variabilis]